MSPAVMTRKSVPMGADITALAQEIREPDSAARRAVEEVVGELPDSLSEAQALSTLLAVGRASVREHINASGYAAVAAAMDEEDRAFAEAAKRRRAERERRRGRGEGQ